MNVGVAPAAQRLQVRRQFIEDADIRQVMDLRGGTLLAALANSPRPAERSNAALAPERVCPGRKRRRLSSFNQIQRCERMSACGLEQTRPSALHMSALRGKADMMFAEVCFRSRFWGKADIE